MTTPEPEDKNSAKSHSHWEDDVERKEVRKLRARRRKAQSIWFGLGTFGMVGWSIVVPTLIGLFIGIWIDRTWPARFSWTLMLLMSGLLLGCYSAWNWLQFEGKWIGNEENNEDEDDDEVDKEDNHEPRD